MRRRNDEFYPFNRDILCSELNNDVPEHNNNHINSNNVENNFGNGSSIRLKISKSRERNSQSGTRQFYLRRTCCVTVASVSLNAGKNNGVCVFFSLKFSESRELWI